MWAGLCPSWRPWGSPAPQLPGSWPQPPFESQQCLTVAFSLPHASDPKDPPDCMGPAHPGSSMCFKDSWSEALIPPAPPPPPSLPFAMEQSHSQVPGESLRAAYCNPQTSSCLRAFAPAVPLPAMLFLLVFTRVSLYHTGLLPSPSLRGELNHMPPLCLPTCPLASRTHHHLEV